MSAFPVATDSTKPREATYVVIYVATCAPVARFDDTVVTADVTAATVGSASVPATVIVFTSPLETLST